MNGVMWAALLWFGLNLGIVLWMRHKGKLWKRDNSVLDIFSVAGTCFFGTIYVCNMCFDVFYGDAVGRYLFLAILVLLILWGYYYLKEKHMQERIYLLDLQNDMLEQNYEKVNSLYAENAKLYHDMKHHLSALERMLRREECTEALGYIESLVEPLRVAAIPVRTGMDIVDTVLFESELRAEKKGVRFQVGTPVFPKDTVIPKKEMCALFSNLLDNALEASREEIVLRVRLAGEMLVIELENDYEETPNIKGNRFESIKLDKKHHGWGTRIIEQIVAKYEGSISYEVEERFRVKIMMNL